MCPICTAHVSIGMFFYVWKLVFSLMCDTTVRLQTWVSSLWLGLWLVTSWISLSVQPTAPHCSKIYMLLSQNGLLSQFMDSSCDVHYIVLIKVSGLEIQWVYTIMYACMYWWRTLIFCNILYYRSLVVPK